MTKTTNAHEAALEMLARRVDRRSFLRGSGLAAATLVGTAAFPGGAFAQGQQSPAVPAGSPGAKSDDKDKDKKDKKDDQTSPDGEAKAGTKDEAKKEDVQAKKDEAPDPYKVAYVDGQGRTFRVCPQCEGNMYLQDKTWTCERCGYSYIE